MHCILHRPRISENLALLKLHAGAASIELLFMKRNRRRSPLAEIERIRAREAAALIAAGQWEASMSMQAMLMPVFAQVALTFVLLFWMQFSRMRAIRQGQVPAHSIALREPNWPPRVTQIGNAYHNQLETPLLFYVLILLALVTSTADSIIFVLSWLFVASRFVHAYIHLTSNRIDRRAPVFLVGAIGLALMWIIIAARLTIAFTG